MNRFIIFALLAVIVSCAKVSPLDGRTEEQAFLEFKKTFNKIYPTEAENSHRLAIFKENIKIIDDLNAKDPHAIFGINEFADLSDEEFTLRYRMKNYTSIETMLGQGPLPVLPPAPTIAALPASYDWSSCVTAIYNQGSCGSCWAFGSTENLETAACIAKKGLRMFSMQELLDCTPNQNGCLGGSSSSALAYAVSNGMMLYNSYPYANVKGTCKFSSSAVAQKFKSWSWVDTSKNENNIQNWVYTYGAPVVGVDAKTWQFYQGGVITTNCGTAIDHSVQITGWTTTGGKLAWKVRNSWGTSWGTAGYIYIGFGSNLCAIAQQPITGNV